VILVLVVALLAGAALAYVALPLGRRGRSEGEPSLEGELDARKTAALSAIVDLENERLVGKLSDEDFDVLRAQYETEALQALTELDALRATSEEPEDAALEAEIAAMRRRLACSRCGGLRSTDGTCAQCQTTT
jgi:hypothetical protein